MTDDSDFITVFRSGDPSAKHDAEAARDRLSAAGIRSIVLGDDAPGVVEGSWEVRAPAADVARAEAILDTPDPELPEEDEVQVDQASRSHDLDFVTLFKSQARDTEMEAISLQSILEAADIPVQVIGSAQFPSLPLEVRVPRTRLEEAMTLMAEARQSGAAAVEGEIE